MGNLKLAISFMIFVLVVGFVLGRSYFLSSGTSSDDSKEASFAWVSPQQEKITLIGEAKDCRLEQGPCRLVLENGEWLELEMGPRPFKINVDLTLKLQVSSETLVPREADFEGLNLNMGYIRPALVKGSDGVYQAQVVLPTCEEKTMEWKILILAQGQNGTDAFGFYFSSED